MAEFKKYKLGDIADIRTSNVDKKITLNQKTVKLCNFVDVYYNWAITKSNYDSFMTATASTFQRAAATALRPMPIATMVSGSHFISRSSES